jgi:hypothetical protein
MSEMLGYAPQCVHGIPMTASCVQCGRWVNTGHPWQPTGTAPSTPTYSLAATVETLSLDYLDFIADCLMAMAERAAPDGGRRRAQFEQLHTESALHRGGAQ